MSEPAIEYTPATLADKLDERIEYSVGLAGDDCDYSVYPLMEQAAEFLRAFSKLEQAHGLCVCGHDLCWHNTQNGKYIGCNDCRCTGGELKREGREQ
jgi:hypothetical protein